MLTFAKEIYNKYKKYKQDTHIRGNGESTFRFKTKCTLSFQSYCTFHLFALHCYYFNENLEQKITFPCFYKLTISKAHFFKGSVRLQGRVGSTFCTSQVSALQAL
jgi:hypothetical protein